jgi:hypothetical protein
MAQGDMAAVEQAFDPECVWHAQRLGILGGDHRGYPAVLRFFGQTMEMTQVRSASRSRGFWAAIQARRWSSGRVPIVASAGSTISRSISYICGTAES